MNAVRISLELLQPLLVTKPRAGEENSSEAYNFIPGSVIRGALIAKYLQVYNTADIARDAHARRFFFEGGCLFLNGYPVCTNGKRMLPVPLSWRQDKGEDFPLGGTVYDFLVAVEDSLKKPKGLEEQFAWTENKTVELYNPKQVIQVHNASQVRGIKQADDSFVYRYEALAACQTFEIVITGLAAAELVEKLSITQGSILFLGGSRTARYGKTVVRIVVHQSDGSWMEAPQSNEGGETVILTLLSDAILLTPEGMPAENLDYLMKCKSIVAFTQHRLVGGFNRKWGLPLPQAYALKAGSVFVYPAAGISKDLLSKVISEGVGQRRIEGFGRVALNWQKESFYNPLLAFRTADKRQHQPVELSEESMSLARKMTERSLRLYLDRRLVEVLDKLDIEGIQQTTPFANLRQGVQSAVNASDLRVIPALVKSMKSSRDLFNRARVSDKHDHEHGKMRFSDWINTEVVKVDDGHTTYPVCDRLILSRVSNIGFAGVNSASMVSDEMKIEYTARLLDGLFRKAIKKAQSSPDRGGKHGDSVE